MQVRTEEQVGKHLWEYQTDFGQTGAALDLPQNENSHHVGRTSSVDIP
jgi:hypothetical protein